MSAPFESEVKRMQHGFAARNGLLAVVLVRDGYVGIKKVYEGEYGGFLDMFSKGNRKGPQFLIEEVTRGLGDK
jgi:aconitate decarboxylase